MAAVLIMKTAQSIDHIQQGTVLFSPSYCVCVCVCVCFVIPLILDARHVDGCTSRGHTQEEGYTGPVPPSFCGACLIFYREKDSAIPSPHEQIVLHLLGIIFIIVSYFFFMRENPSSCGFPEIRTHVPTSESFEVTK